MFPEFNWSQKRKWLICLLQHVPDVTNFKLEFSLWETISDTCRDITQNKKFSNKYKTSVWYANESIF